MASITDAGRKASISSSSPAWRRALALLAGFALLAAGMWLLVALATHDRGDPSWNQSISAIVNNAMGLAGAQVSDALLQTVGLAAWLLPLVLLDWAARLVISRGLKRLWFKAILLPFLLLAGATAIAIVPPYAGWPLKVGLGGVVGKIGRDGFAHINVAPPLSAMAAALLVTLLLIYLLGWSSLNLVPRTADKRRPGARQAERTRVRSVGALWARSRAALASWYTAFWQGEQAENATLGGAYQRRREPRLTARHAVVEEVEESDEEVTEPKAKRVAQIDVPRRAKKREAQRQALLDLEPTGEHLLPPLEMLNEVTPSRFAEISADALQQNARLLETVLADFGIQGQIVKVRPGPVVALYELEPAPGIKASRVIGLADDIARSMSAISARVAVIPGRNVIGIELPNARAEVVYLRELLASEDYERTAAKLALVLGKDIGGTPVIADLARMPHLLIAGTTGSGKSVGINTMILSILYRMPPDQCKFIMIDPKMLELSVYDGIPHLLAPVVTEARKAVVALKWTVREMENRYRAMSKLGVRNIEGYNQRLAEAKARGEVLKRRVQTGFDEETGRPMFEEQPLASTPLPLIIVVVDEMADLMLVAGKDIEAAVQRLAQMARAAGIHIVMATQRPSVDVITGTIKANFPTRISFQVTSKIDSRTILGEAGAEQLLGRGDMLFMAGGGRITRVHGPFVSDEEVERVVRFLKENGGPPTYIEEVTEDEDDEPGMSFGAESVGSGDQLYDQAVALVCRERKASTSFVQRHLQIGYNRAARIIERMESEGVVSPANHVGKREVLGRNIDEE